MQKQEKSYISEQACEEVYVETRVLRYITVPSKPPKRSVDWLSDAANLGNRLGHVDCLALSKRLYN